jgi:hypothetical protein
MELIGARRNGREGHYGAVTATVYFRGMTSSRVFIPILLIAGVTALTGCSVASPGAGSNPTSGASASASTSAGAGSETDAPSGPFPCNQFSLSYIKKISGYGVTVAQPISAVGNAAKKSCEYSDGRGHSIGIEAAPGEGAAALQIFSEIENTGGPVTGIGDSAWGNESELAVVFGTDYVNVTDDSDVDDDSATLANIGLDTLKQMVLKVHAAMGNN